MTVESTIRDLLQGKGLRKESPSINLREGLAQPVSSRMQSTPGADDVSINKTGSQMKPPVNAAAADNSSTSPKPNTGTSTDGTKAADTTTTNPNPNASQNASGRPSVEDMIRQHEYDKNAPQREYEKKLADWEAKYGKTYRQQQAQKQYDQQWEKGVRDSTVNQQSAQIEADRQAAKNAASYVRPEDTLNFTDVEASRQRAADVRQMYGQGKYDQPTRLSPEELAAKRRAQGENVTAADITKEREQLAQKRIELDAARPEGQPKSFTDKGESPEFGKRADGTKVGPFTEPEQISGQEDERSPGGKALGPPSSVGFGGDDTMPQPGGGITVSSSNKQGSGIAGAGINTGSENIQRKEFNFTRRVEGFSSFIGKDIRKKMISEALINLINK